VTLQATVAAPSNAPTPSGTVDFYSGATLLGSAPLNAQGVATYSASNWTAGSYSLTAAYGGLTEPNLATYTTGIAHFATSNSNAIPLAVGPTPTAVLSISPPTILLGQSATLTWSSTNTTGCATSWSAPVAPSGTYIVTPQAAESIQYTLACTGFGGTATGAATLTVNTAASTNSEVGTGALTSNTTGYSNAAVGYDAMYANTTGPNNTALGSNALYSNTSGKGNAAQGVNALYSNTTGIRNLAIGSNALYKSNGSYNIALGFDAGYNVTQGSNNIEIGSVGETSDDGTIQIGMQGTQVLAKIAGIFGTQITGSTVYVTSTGQLGVQGSSERFKTDIAGMPEMSAKLEQLRPVTFRYKSDPHNVTQYGLIAEEVAAVYPELVIRDDMGQIQGIHYEELAPLLLQEVQQQRHQLLSQSGQLAAQRDELDAERVLRDGEGQKIALLERQLAAQASVQESTAAAWNAELNALKQELTKLQKSYSATQGAATGITGSGSGEDIRKPN
jgi:hypothetical protein